MVEPQDTDFEVNKRDNFKQFKAKILEIKHTPDFTSLANVHDNTPKIENFQTMINEELKEV